MAEKKRNSIKDYLDVKKNAFLYSSSILLIVVVFLVGYIYIFATVDQISTAILDMDHQSTSQTITRQFIENEKFDVQYQVNDTGSLQDLIKDKKVDIGFVIPPGLSDDIKRQKGADVLLMVDGTNYIIANSASAKAMEIVETMNVGISIQTLQGKGMVPYQANNMARTIQLEKNTLFNPTNNYSYYLTFGLLGAAAFSFLMSSSGISFIRHLQDGAVTKKRVAALMAVFTGIATLAINGMYLIGIGFFHLPNNGNYLDVFVLTILYSLLIVTFGFFLAMFLKDEVKILQATVFVVTPLFFITGFSWPISQIPEILKPLTWLTPMSPFLHGVRSTLIMGGDLQYILKDLEWLGALVIGFVPLFFTVFWYQNRDVKMVKEKSTGKEKNVNSKDKSINSFPSSNKSIFHHG